MSAFAETAYAKINLALHIRRRRADGYHDIETLFAFAKDGDRLTATSADDISLTVTGIFGEGLSTGRGNLVVRTAELMKDTRAGCPERCLHHARQAAAGSVGYRRRFSGCRGHGASVCAACGRIEADDGALERLLAPLGADIPACVKSRTVYGDGTGTDLQTVSDADDSWQGRIAGQPVAACGHWSGV